MKRSKKSIVIEIIFFLLCVVSAITGVLIPFVLDDADNNKIVLVIICLIFSFLCGIISFKFERKELLLKCSKCGYRFSSRQTRWISGTSGFYCPRCGSNEESIGIHK